MAENEVTIELDDGHRRQTKSFTLDRQLTIGRESDNDIVIASETASRKHAALVFEAGTLQLRNLSSKNPIHILGDDQRDLTPGDMAVIHEGSIFKVSDVTFVIHTTPSAAKGTDVMTVICPHCGRSLPARLRECPYDGYSLASATTRAVPEDFLDNLEK